MSFIFVVSSVADGDAGSSLSVFPIPVPLVPGAGAVGTDIHVSPTARFFFLRPRCLLSTSLSLSLPLSPDDRTPRSAVAVRARVCLSTNTSRRNLSVESNAEISSRRKSNYFDRFKSDAVSKLIRHPLTILHFPRRESEHSCDETNSLVVTGGRGIEAFLAAIVRLTSSPFFGRDGIRFVGRLSLKSPNSCHLSRDYVIVRSCHLSVDEELVGGIFYKNFILTPRVFSAIAR